jgi:hypothetical protein
MLHSAITRRLPAVLLAAMVSSKVPKQSHMMEAVGGCLKVESKLEAFFGVAVSDFWSWIIFFSCYCMTWRRTSLRVSKWLLCSGLSLFTNWNWICFGRGMVEKASLVDTSNVDMD